MSKGALVITRDPPLGERLLCREDPSTDPQHITTNGQHNRLQGLLADEEVFALHCTAVWSSSGVVRRRISTPTPILKVGWCRFHASQQEELCCVLQKGVFSACSMWGEQQDTTLDQPVSAFWPLPQGVLLSAPEGSSTWLLTHPLSELQPVVANVARAGPVPSWAGWAGERIVWSSLQLPIVATFNDATGRLAIWRAMESRLDASKFQEIADLPPATPGMPPLGPYSPLQALPPVGTPMTASSPATTIASQSATKRPSIRTPEGGLSPAVFNPTPRSGPNLPSLGRTHFTPPPGWASQLDPSFYFQLLHSEALPPTQPPCEGHLATDPQGYPLLALLCPQAQLLIAFRLPHDAKSAVSRLFDTPAISVAAVEATRRRPGGDPARMCRELLLLRPGGQLALLQGSTTLCHILVPAPQPPVPPAAPPLSAPSDTMDDSMGCSHPDTPAHLDGAAIANLQCPSGNQVDMVLHQGGRVRIMLPLHCADPLPSAPLAALEAVLDEAALHALCRRFVAHPGGCSGRLPTDWGAFSDTLLLWAQDPSGFISAAADPPSAPPRPAPSAASPIRRQAAASLSSPSTPLSRPAPPTPQSVAPMSITPHPNPHPPFPSVQTYPHTPAHSASSMSITAPTPHPNPSESRDTLMSPETPTHPPFPHPPGPDLSASPSPSSRPPPATPTSHYTRGPEPGPGPGSAWEALRRRLPPGKYAWVKRTPQWAAPAASPPADAAPLPTCVRSTDASLVGRALQALHCCYEDLKLHSLHWALLPLLGTTLAHLAVLLGARPYWDHYARDLGPARLREAGADFPAAWEGPHPALPPPADVHRVLAALLAGTDGSRWAPHLAALQAPCTQRTSHLLACYSLLSQCSSRCAAILQDARSRGSDAPVEKLGTAVREGAEQLVLLMVQQGWGVEDLDTLPVGVALPLQEALQRCRFNPPPGWPIAAYALIGREDIVATMIASQDPTAPPPSHEPKPPMQPPAPNTPAPPGAPDIRPPAPRAMTPMTPGSALSLPSVISVESMSLSSATSTPLGGALLEGAGPWGLGGDQVPQVRNLVEGLTASPPSWDGLLRPYTQRLQVAAASPEAPAAPSPASSSAPSRPSSAASNAAGQAAADAAGERRSSTLDGMEGLSQGTARLRFGRDNRLAEVQRLLASARPNLLRVNAAEGDPELPAKQQAVLRAMAVRTMSLPLGRGALTLGTLHPLPTEPLEVPFLCLAGVLPESGATVNLDLSAEAAAPGGGAASEITAWPEFHNGVAAGLRLARGAGVGLRPGCLIHPRPEQPTYTNAGVLLALGLTGHLSRFPMTQLYRFFTQQHDPTTLAIVLGMAAARRGSCDPTAARMLFLHVPSCHPDSYPEIEVSPLVQSAALLGVGLLYEGSCNRQMAEVMLSQINRRPGQHGGGGDSGGQGQDGGSITQDREGYALAAGFALGLIALGRGSSAVGLSDLRVEERLRSFMCGGSNMGAAARKGPGAMSRGAPSGLESLLGPGTLGWDPAEMLGDDLTRVRSSLGITPRPSMDPDHPVGPGSSQVVLEQHAVNLNVTSPAATMALCLMYLKTNDTAVAAAFQLPDTRFALDSVRPDFVLLRMLGRSLVMWDSIRPTQAWVHAQLPPLLQTPLPTLMSRLARAGPGGGGLHHRGDVLAQAHSHVQAVAGAGLAIGLRFAGSMNAQAEEVLRHYINYLLAAKKKLPDASAAGFASGGLDRPALEGCIDVLALALAVVLAGSGHLPTFRLLRLLSLQRDSPSGGNRAPAVQYGSQCAISLASGLLFLGGGLRTLATSNQAIAALLIALFPRFPAASVDNRCHLQAFRHLYVLASEARCVEAIDVDSRQPVYVPLEITIDRTAAGCPPDPPEPSSTPAEEEAVLKLSTRQNVPGESTPVLNPRGPRVGFSSPETAGMGSPEGGGGADDDGLLARFQRVAPCLLPERDQVVEVRVKGPRYWPQRLDRTSPSSGPSPLDRLYSQGVIYVKKKAGSLAYAEDPSGTRSLLSRAFRSVAPTPLPAPAGAGTPMSSVQDLVHLTATFSADPFIRAFALHICGGQLTGGASGRSGQDSAAARDAAELAAFCRGALYECITAEKSVALPWYLQLYSLVRAVLGGGGGRPVPQVAVQQLVGGGGLTMALANLKLAHHYYSACSLAAATAALDSSTAQLPGSGEEPPSAAAWAPLLQPAFLEGLWHQLQHHFQRLALLPKPQPCAAPTAPRTMLHSYLASGSMQPSPSAAGDELEAAWREQLFAACLTLHDIPSSADAAPAVQAASQMAADMQLANPRAAAVPLLAACLKDVSPEALLHLAACLD